VSHGRPKLTKKETHYTPKAMIPQEACSRCVHYRRPNVCAMVEGHINPAGWCNRFIKRATGPGERRVP